ncbi:MAG: hypothetical protein LKG25_07285 [Prevotella sp.]|jgi:hypothetical protein|nr:hypothetical protein [Prevotella sp.]MCI1282384.1 hypothetical protein [Prevotella sp.]
MKLKTILAGLLMMIALSVSAESNETQAHNILIRALDILQNPGGASLNYKLDFSFIHKQGYVIFKGRKFQRRSKRTIDWFDGTTFWSMNRESEVVKISNPKKRMEDDDASLTEQMNLVRNGCRYAVTSDGGNWKIYVKAVAKEAKIKNAEVWINKVTYEPTKVRVKFGFLWVTITLWNVTAANYSDSNFEFNYHKYPHATIVDKRR